MAEDSSIVAKRTNPSSGKFNKSILVGHVAVSLPTRGYSMTLVQDKPEVNNYTLLVIASPGAPQSIMQSGLPSVPESTCFLDALNSCTAVTAWQPSVQ